jgi:hypothetical protein
MKSRTDIDEPNATKPYTDKEDPRRIKLRKEIEEPICTKSRIDRDDPKRLIPYTDRDDPKRAKLRRDRELPIWM